MGMPPPTHKQPVALAAWLAASQPELGPARRGVLQVVAEMSQDGVWVPSNEIKKMSGTQRQPVNRHLRALEVGGLVLLEYRGKGLPLYVKATAAGLRAVGLRGPQLVAENLPAPLSSADATPPAPPAREETPAPPAAAKAPSLDSRLMRLVQGLYQELSPYLQELDQEEFGLILRQSLVKALRGDNGSKSPEHRPEATAARAPARLLPSPVQPMPRPLAPAARAVPTQDGPPALNPAEEALEQRLIMSCHPDYRSQAWWEKTKDFSNQWDQTNRRRHGSLGTSFTSFEPRWQHSEWSHFNQARRQADAQGALYSDWVHAQFDRRNDAVAPADLHGDEALTCWRRRLADQRGESAPETLVQAPYTPESFNVFNPDHAAYAERLLTQITSLSQRVYGDDPDGAVRLLSQAISGGNLPASALELRPQLKQRVLAALGPRYLEASHPQATTAAHGFKGFNDNSPGKPAVII